MNLSFYRGPFTIMTRYEIFSSFITIDGISNSVFHSGELYTQLAKGIYFVKTKEKANLFDENYLIYSDKNSILDLSYSDKRIIHKRDNYTCLYCGKTTDNPTIDHIKPRSRGGTNDPKNLTTCCINCNTAKGDLDVQDFMPGLLIGRNR